MAIKKAKTQKNVVKKSLGKTTTSKKVAKKSKKNSGAGGLTPTCTGVGDKLVILESPNKIASVAKYLGAGWRVMASYGHIRGIAKGKTGLDKKTWATKFEISEGKENVVKALKREAKKAKEIYLATDPDREGEAIAWHIYAILQDDTNAPFYRLMFNAITKTAILDSIKNKTSIDMDMVYSQRARQIVDRLVGFEISGLVTQNLGTIYGNHQSAGRVQSIAVQIIAERQKEIDAFVPEEFWDVHLLANIDGDPFKLKLFNYKKKAIKTIDTEAKVQKICDEIKANKALIKVSNVTEVEKIRKPKPPFTTSTLQQSASTNLNFSMKKTMDTAQKLFASAHISYHRSDSVRLEPAQIQNARDIIEQNFGSKYLPKTACIYKTKSKGKVQDAHTAIQPTHPEIESITASSDEKKLYTLIRNRFLACQAAASKYKVKTIIVSIGDYDFKMSGSLTTFDGFLKIEKSIIENSEEINVPDVTTDSLISFIKILQKRKETTPPHYFNDASLVKLMEANGIGRPSTYANTVENILKKRYVEKQGKQMHATQPGIAASDYLKAQFKDFFNMKFTAEIENELDKIENGKQKWTDFLDIFWAKLSKIVNKVKQQVVSIDDTGEKCHLCGSKILTTKGRYGPYCKCSNNECKAKFDAKFDAKGNFISVTAKKEAPVVGVCTKCGKNVVKKSGRFGDFYTCSGFPKCKTIYLLQDDGSIIIKPPTDKNNKFKKYKKNY